MHKISCSKCQENDEMSYYITSCGDLILCENCATEFVTIEDCICSKCNQKVEIMPYEQSEQNKEIFCNEHQKKCDYYCQNCQEYLCGDCIFEQLSKPKNKHKGHKILKIEELLDGANQQAADAIKALQPLYDSISQSIEKYKSIKASIESKYDDTLILMHNSFRKIQSHIDKAKEEYSSKIIEKIDKNESLMKSILEITENCEIVLKSNDTQILSTACSISEKISKIVQEAETAKEEELPTLPKNIFTNELIPPFSGFTIVIPKFVQSYTEKNFQTIYSPSVDMYHGKWRTKILLSEKENITNLSIFIDFLSGIGSPLLIEYKIQINHPTTNKVISKSFKSEFNVMDSWGWLKFTPIDSIIDGGFVKEDDSLSLDIKLRPASYAEYSKIFEKLLCKYKGKYKELKQKSKEMKNVSQKE